VQPGEHILLKYWHWYDFDTWLYTYEGLVEVSLNGGNWEPVSDTFTGSSLVWTQYIVDLTIYQGEDIRLAFHYIAGGSGPAHWGWYIDDISIGEPLVGISDLPNTPITFTLNNAYPNPFNPSTKITYSIPELSFVTLKVYDVLGNEVANLVNEEKPAGSYEINFNASNLSSGIYFYRLQANDFTQIKKMILLK